MADRAKEIIVSIMIIAIMLGFLYLIASEPFMEEFYEVKGALFTTESTTEEEGVIEGPPVDGVATKEYDPAKADPGIPEFAGESDGRVDITVGKTALRSYPNEDLANIYGYFKNDCLIHTDKFYIFMDGQTTFYGVNVRQITDSMIIPDENALTKYSADRDNIVWFNKNDVALNK